MHKYTRHLQIIAILLIVAAGFLWTQRWQQQIVRQAKLEIHDNSADQLAIVKEKVDEKTNVFELVDFGRSLLAAGNADFAVVALEKATTLKPGYRDAWYLLGVAYAKQGHLPEAIDALNKAHQIDANHAPTNELLRQLKSKG